jgi:hypothetical protein
VFNFLAELAYAEDADFYYRINDDSEMITPWVNQLVLALDKMGPPYGAVGPSCPGGTPRGILTHDFVHRTHMEIFKPHYYPPVFADWWMDDWITRTYGRKRTKRMVKIQIHHHIYSHGQRYAVNKAHEQHLTKEVTRGRDKVIAFAAQAAKLGSSGAEASPQNMWLVPFDAAAVKSTMLGDYYGDDNMAHSLE